MATLADDLLLVLLDPDSGRPRTDGTRLDYALAGALLLELALAERIEAAGPKPRSARVVVVDDRPLDDELLSDALRRVADKPRRADKLVPLLAKRLRGRLLERAERRGDVHRQRRTLLPDRWPASEGSSRPRLVADLRGVLVDGRPPDARTAALVALLAAIDAAPKAVDAPDRAGRKAIKRRAKEIGESDWAPEAVRRAVRAVEAATAAVVVVIAAGGAASS